MKYNINDTITLDNNLEYLIVDVVNFNDNTYLYLINNSEENDNCVLLKEVINNGETTLVSIQDKNEFDDVLTKLAINNKDNIAELINN